MRPHTWKRAAYRKRRARLEWLREARRKGGTALWVAIMTNNRPRPSPSGWKPGMKRRTTRMWKYRDPMLEALKARAAELSALGLPPGRQMIVPLETGR